MPKPRKLKLYVVSTDFDTTGGRTPPYYQLKTLLEGMGGVISATHQITLLLTPLSAVDIRDAIAAQVLGRRDRVYVGKIAKGSAWRNLRGISNVRLKDILKMFASAAEPTKAEIASARKWIEGLYP
jgi:hypothetical protein